MKGNVMDLQGEGWKVLAGSCLDRLPELADESVDAVVCDPPYELGFMGKSWDSSGIAYNVNVWRECLRVLKPGGHILAFGGSRTWHRLAVAVEDAGFELRDSIAWLYGSGFPKSLNVGKSIEAKLTTGSAAKNGFHKLDGERSGDGKIGMYATVAEQGFRSHNPEQLGAFELEATTAEAKKWAGWGTALKPAFEPVVVGRKPLKGTVAANVLAYGVGGLNIDGTRLPTTDKISVDSYSGRNKFLLGGLESVEELRLYASDDRKTPTGESAKKMLVRYEAWLASTPPQPAGRWPSNVILDEYTAELVDQQSGISKSPPVGSTCKSSTSRDGNILGKAIPKQRPNGHGDSGGASRFFYIAKANKRDRNEGLDHLEAKRASAMGYDIGLGEAGEGMFKDRNPQKQNFHPTVKPTDLMRQLIRLVTPLGGVVLDPFTGSGSTGKAAILEGMQFIGCELTPDYLPIIQGRIEWAVEQVKQDKLKADQEQAEVLF